MGFNACRIEREKKALLAVWSRCISRKHILPTHFIFNIEEVSIETSYNRVENLWLESVNI